MLNNLTGMELDNSRLLYPGSPYIRGRLSTVDFLVLTSIDELLLIMKRYLLFYRTGKLNEEVNRTEPSPSVMLPWIYSHFH
jgi:hypothetical protein